ncbi:MAG: heme NO-binding domain-containing protein [Gammaproteobacteria bacterium]
MKGMVFTEFLDMVEQQHSAALVDDIIDACELPSGGAYTAVGTYDHREMVDLVVELSRRLDTPVPDLLQAFGTHLFGRFVAAYPHFFTDVDSAFALLHGIEDVIHKEVRKLYPEAELPRFETAYDGPDRLVMVYRSPRHMEDLAEGLIRACIAHYGESVQLERTSLDEGDGASVRFVLTRTA